MNEPVYIEQPQWKIWPLILGAVVLLFVVFHELDRQAAVRAAGSKESFVSDWNGGRIATASDFAARCGQPRLVDREGRLHYSSGAAGDYLVTLGATSCIELEHVVMRFGKPQTNATRVWPEQIYTVLHCR